LETKWGIIKHDVSKFIGVYSQVMRLNRSGTSASDTLKRAHELYKQKNEKGSDFSFEHCWVLLRDHPKWSEGWTQVKIVTPKRKAPCASEEEDSDIFDLGEMERSVATASEEGGGSAEGGGLHAEASRVFKGRPGGVKAAKNDVRQGKIHEGLMLAHAEATRSMAAAHMRKAAILEDQNLLMLMSMPDDDEDAKEYLRLRRQMELKKLRKFVAEEECRDAEANPVIAVNAANADVPVDVAGAWSPGAEGDEEQVGDWPEHTEYTTQHTEYTTQHTEAATQHNEGATPHMPHTEFGATPANWFTLEHVDRGQPTQFRVLGEHTECSNSQTIDLDGYQENLGSSEDNVHFGLSLHGQYR
jgi:hypothetical protein